MLSQMSIGMKIDRNQSAETTSLGSEPNSSSYRDTAQRFSPVATIPCAGLLQGSHAGALFLPYSRAPVRNSLHRPTHDEIDERQKSLLNPSDTSCLTKSAERLISRTQRRWMCAKDPLGNISPMDSLVANQQHPDHWELFRIINRSGISCDQ
jgi:hypothetical protein